MPTNESDLDWTEYDEGDATFRRKRLSAPTDASKLGCSLYELPPGERAWPYHYHTANEEAMYVLAGSGKVRRPDGMDAVAAGEYLAFPADERGGHRVINDSDETLRYLAISTMNEPDVTVYPDSEKFGVFVGSPPGSQRERDFQGYFPMAAETGYWDE